MVRMGRWTKPSNFIYRSWKQTTILASICGEFKTLTEVYLLFLSFLNNKRTPLWTLSSKAPMWLKRKRRRTNLMREGKSAEKWKSLRSLHRRRHKAVIKWKQKPVNQHHPPPTHMFIPLDQKNHLARQEETIITTTIRTRISIHLLRYSTHCLPI